MGLLVGRVVGPDLRRRLLVPLMTAVGLPLVGFAIAGLPVVLGGALLVVAGTGFAYSLALQQRFRDIVPETVCGETPACPVLGPENGTRQPENGTRVSIPS